MTTQYIPPLPKSEKDMQSCDKLHQTNGPVFPDLSPSDIDRIIRTACGARCEEVFGKGESNVFFLPEAWLELQNYVRYGKTRPVNIYEQEYDCEGRLFLTKDGILSAVVSHIIPILSAQRSRMASVLVQTEQDNNIYDRVRAERDVLRENEKKANRYEDGSSIDPFISYGRLEAIMLGHTHPNLGVFFSTTDYGSSYATPSFPAGIIVCDPIRKDLKAALGVGFQEATIKVYKKTERMKRSMDEREAIISQRSTDPSVNELLNGINSAFCKGQMKGSFSHFIGKDGKLHISLKATCDLKQYDAARN